MWVGFNSEITGDDSPQQVISYLTPINSSPTNTAVVLETMQQSITILEELNQSYIQVTYDLAIAKIALQIQASEKPKFDRLFVHLGAFHLMLFYFKAIGKIMIVDCQQLWLKVNCSQVDLCQVLLKVSTLIGVKDFTL